MNQKSILLGLHRRVLGFAGLVAKNFRPCMLSRPECEKSFEALEAVSLCCSGGAATIGGMVALITNNRREGRASRGKKVQRVAQLDIHRRVFA